MSPQRHPLHPIQPGEISQVADAMKKIIRRTYGDDTQIAFMAISIREPPKTLLLPYLDAEASGVPPGKRPFVPRCAQVTWTIQSGRTSGEHVISLDSLTELDSKLLEPGQYVNITRDELIYAQGRIDDALVKKTIEDLGLPKGTTVQCDPWPYGADRDSTPETPRYIAGLLYARGPVNDPESNQYAFHLPFSPVLDVYEDKVVRIDKLASGGEEDGFQYDTAQAKPLAHCEANEYHPSLTSFQTRTDLKPLIVNQVDFTVSDGNSVSWQKWRFRVGFNYREGLTLHDIRYDGRPVFYRLSVSEMTVPYGDPRSPFHRKQAFDLGDLGAGANANNLALGCDCLGSIKYFNGYLVDDAGVPYDAGNVICMHEQDAGIGWKHTNVRTGGVAITRARNLILQTILIVGNYEYIFAWIFWQNGNIELETRATGILSTSLIDPDKKSPWGNVVSPGVLAANHQHLFSLRIDPMIDGRFNSVIQEDSLAIPQGEENPHGNAWRIHKTPFTTSGFADDA